MDMVISFKMDNDAFGPMWSEEAAHILRELAVRLENHSFTSDPVTGEITHPISDTNGHKVGSWSVAQRVITLIKLPQVSE